MKSEEERGTGENELKKVREQLFQIKLILAAILLLLLAPFVGPGPVLQTILIGLMGLAAIYAGLWTFDRLVKRKVGQDWGEAQLASFLDDNATQDSNNSTESR